MSTASELRVHSTDLLSPDVLTKLRQRSDWMGLFLIAHAWAIIFAAMSLFAFIPNPLTFIIAIALIGSRQLGLAILMHDAAHHALMTTPRRNYYFGDWLCAFPVLSNTRAYRHYHLRHHALTQQEEDPDLILSAPFPITRKSFMRKIWRDISGQTGLSQRIEQFRTSLGTPDMPRRKRIVHFWHKLGGGLIAQSVIFTLCALFFEWYFYLTFWVLPLLTWQMLVTRIRNIAEHAMVPDNNDPFRNARTTLAAPLTRLFLAPYWVNYHIEHHLIMYLPCYRLPTLHRALQARHLHSHMEIAKNYWDVLRQATSLPNDLDHRGAHKRGNFGEGFEAHTS